MRLLPRVRRRAIPRSRPRPDLTYAARLAATSVTLALVATVLPGLGLSLPEAAAADAGTIRDVPLPLEVGSAVAPARVEDGRLHADRRPAGAAVAAWQSPAVDVGDARMLGLSWDGSEPGVRVRTDSGDGWSDWTELETDGSAADPGSPDDQHPGRVFSQPLWLEEGTKAIQVQVTFPETGEEHTHETIDIPLPTPGGDEPAADGVPAGGAPVADGVPAGEGASAGGGVPAGGAPAAESEPAGGAPAGDGVPVGEGAPAGDGVPVGDGAPAGGGETGDAAETAGSGDVLVLDDLQAHLIEPDMTPTASPEAGAGAALARPNAPAIISRARWGANERLRRGDPTYIRHVQVGFLHHTVQSNTYRSWESAALVRSVYLYHTQSQGYADIGYNFLVDRYGNIFEGRAGGVGQAVMGAHTGGFNHASFGVALIGDFDNSQIPSNAHSALARLFAWKMDLHHIDPQGASLVPSTGGGTSRYPAGQVIRLNAISGHRDTGRTACPGRYGYEFLNRLRVGVARTGLPKIYGGRVNRTTVTPGGEPVIMGVSFSAHVNWTAIITHSNGTELRRWSGQGTATRLVWDGHSAGGWPSLAGVATIRVYAHWRGRHARPVVSNIRVVR